MAPKRTLKRASKTIDSSDIERRRIERLLGEDFDTLAQARRALKRESTPVSEKAFKASQTRAKNLKANIAKIPRKPSYTIRELNGNQKRALQDLLTDKTTVSQLDEQLLRPGEQWGAQITYDYTGRDLEQHKGQARTYQLYGRLDQLFRKLTEYVQHGLKQRPTVRNVNKFLDNVKVIRWGKQSIEPKELLSERRKWDALKKEEVAKRKARKQALKQRLQKAESRARKAERELAKERASKSSKKGKRK